MSCYRPDQWALVKITGTDPHYRVFGSWSGGYLDSDSWRMNSGVIGAKKENNKLIFSGHSGSIYECNAASYGISNAYNASVLADLCERSGGKMEVVHDMPNFENFDWIIS